MKVIALVLLVYAVRNASALPNLIDALGQNQASVILDLIDQAGLTDTLKTGGPFTILAPTDDAFAKIPKDDLDAIKANPSDLTNILQYHVINGEIFSWDLKSNEHLTSLNGHVVRVYSDIVGKHYFNQALVVKEEIQASNGVIYMINEPLDVPEGTVVQILGNQDYNISEFLNLVKIGREAGLLNSTTNTYRYTVFAPSNTAIKSLPADVLSRIKNSPQYARLLVEYHIHRGTLHAQSLKPGSLSTLYSQHYIGVTNDPDGNTKLNAVASLVLNDIEAENGVVHVISHVLIPSSLAPVVG